LVSQFGEFINLLKSSPDGEDSTLLDNSAVVMTSELADGDLHNHMNLPCLLAGRAGGALDPGRYIASNDLFMRLLVGTAQAVGADINTWGSPPIEGVLENLLT
jgi:hypothetical protein